MPKAPITLTEKLGSIAGYTFTVRRLWIEVSYETKTPPRFSELALLDTGAPMCVSPFEIHTKENLDWQRLTSPTSAQQTTWSGAPCDIGRVRVWIPDTNVQRRGPFFMIAKFPRSTLLQMIRRSFNHRTPHLHYRQALTSSPT